MLWNMAIDIEDEGDLEAPIDVVRLLTRFEREALDDAMSGNRLTTVQIELMKEMIDAEVLTRYEIMILHDVCNWLFEDEI